VNTQTPSRFPALQILAFAAFLCHGTAVTTFAQDEVPDAPTNVVVTPGNGEVTVSFTPPPDVEGAPNTGYIVTRSPSTRIAGSSSPIQITGLTPGSTYTFTVSAINENGESPASAPPVAATPYGTPGQVLGSSISCIPGNRQASVDFSPSLGNGLVNTYTVSAIPGGATATGSTNPILVSGLTNGVAYNFTVQASNAAGSGLTSTPSTNTVTPDTISSWTWTRRTIPGFATAINKVAWSPSQSGIGRYVAVGDSGRIALSSDGVIWSAQNSNSTENLNSVTWGNGLFVAVGHLGRIVTSPDGVTWSIRNSNTSNLLQSVVWADTQFVAVGSDGTVNRSKDGLNWSSISNGVDIVFTALAYHDMFVAVGGNGKILTSSDGITWTLRNSTGATLTAVTWAGTQWVAVGFFGRILMSSNGITWSSKNSGIGTLNLRGVVSEGGRLLAVGWDGSIFAYDAQSQVWIRRASGSSSILTSATASGPAVIVTGANGTILQAPRTIPQITYTTPQAYALGTPISPLTPVNVGGEATTWSITPDLSVQTGLSFNTATGVITGTPTVVSAAQVYKVVASNARGTDSATFSISTYVWYAPPTSLTYLEPLGVYAQHAGATMNRAMVGGGTENLTWQIVSGTLPPGLEFSSVNGNIYGTPTTNGVYPLTVRVSNSGGYAEAQLTLTVRHPTPILSILPISLNAIVGQSVGTIKPVNSGGTVSRWSIEPDLTANTGLLFNTTTGAILGTPTRPSALTTYLITGYGTNGSTPGVNISISVSAGTAPTVSYPDSLYTWRLGESVTLSKSGATGAITGYSISPALPKGLLFNTTTGKITGIPAVVSVESSYIITAYGSGTTGKDTVRLAISGSAPTVSYANTPYNYPVNSVIAPLTKTGATGIITAYSINPPLPAGLRFNTTTGAILGTPTEVVTARDYVISATGPGGYGADTVNITVSAPTMFLSYPAASWSFQPGQDVDIRKDSITGIVTSYSISPALPEGLRFNTTTGRILGTALQIISSTNYTVTAHGPGGTATAIFTLQVSNEFPTLVSYDHIQLLAAGTDHDIRPQITGPGIPVKWEIGIGSNGRTLTENTGLLFNPTTGGILGTPENPSPRILYPVTVFCVGGFSISTELNVGIFRGLGKSAVGNAESFSVRVTGQIGSMYSLRIPVAFGTAERVTVSVADLSGRSVWSKEVNARDGVRELIWDGKAKDGRAVSAGMYMVRVTAVENGRSVTVSEKAPIGF
jgi:hypothetical protein